MLALIIATGALVPQAQASELRHKVGANETLTTVAKNYYGAAWKAVYIIARNDLNDNEAAPAEVIVPASWMYKIRRGDSLASIAKRFLGDSGRYKAVAAFNKGVNSKDLAVGTPVLMPFHLQHTVSKGESLATVARRYYRTIRLAELLREYNSKSTNTLEVGEKLVIPIFDADTVNVKQKKYIAAQSPSPDASNEDTSTKAANVLANANDDPDHETQKRAAGSAGKLNAAEDLEAALAEYRQGYFAESCFRLEGLLAEPSFDEPQRIIIISHLGFCAIAAGDDRAARDYFRKWLELEPTARLHPITTSPKILLVFEEVTEAAKATAKAAQTDD